MTYAGDPFPKVCRVCGASYGTAEAWRALPLVGEQGRDAGLPCELRNCGCGGTLAIALVEMEPRLLVELAHLFVLEADALEDSYAWPPRAPLTDAERATVEHLRLTSEAIWDRTGDLPPCPEDAISAGIAASLSRTTAERASMVRGEGLVL